MRRFLGPALTLSGLVLAIGSILVWRDAWLALVGGLLFSVGSYLWFVR